MITVTRVYGAGFRLTLDDSVLAFPTAQAAADFIAVHYPGYRVTWNV